MRNVFGFAGLILFVTTAGFSLAQPPAANAQAANPQARPALASLQVPSPFTKMLENMKVLAEGGTLPSLNGAK